jgi:hypothetical protein
VAGHNGISTIKGFATAMIVPQIMVGTSNELFIDIGQSPEILESIRSADVVKSPFSLSCGISCHRR